MIGNILTPIIIKEYGIGFGLSYINKLSKFETISVFLLFYVVNSSALIL